MILMLFEVPMVICDHGGTGTFIFHKSAEEVHNVF